MTIFVVSLFLPNTINFATSQSRPKSPQRRPSSTATVLSDKPPSLFEALREGKSDALPLTPGATTDHERIFHPNRSALQQLPFRHSPQYVAPSDPHSPAWGAARTFNQPTSRASSPPPSSILKHGKGRDKRERAASAFRNSARRYKALEASRTSSHERSFSDTEWTVVPADQGNGGLRNSVKAAVRSGFLQEKTWVGTLGMPTDALEDHVKSNIAEKLEDDCDSLTVFVSDSDFDGHYSHYSKTILWPVFHYQIPDNPKSKAYEDHSWIYYVNVNQAFADRIAKNWKRGDVIWIHDYHLLLVPQMVRKLVPDAQIGFFLHVAFPSSEVFRCLAVRKELLEGMLGANLIGFQTEEYCHHFLQTCSRLLSVEATPEGVQLDDRHVDVGKFPIGIDPESLSKRRENPDVEEWIKTIRDKYKGKRIIVARDKLDHIRGVRQKLLAYELFLNKYPHFKDKIVLIQVATSTTEQAELDATVSDIVTRVNSMHSTLAHQPLVFLKQDISFAQYLALITIAELLMITSLREGMNLTSHEYLFCQDGKHASEKHGPLILSEFTGSASVLGRQALLINPWDYRQTADAIKQALEMEPAEREERWLKLHHIITHHTAALWFSAFISTLLEAWTEHSARDTISVPRLSVSALGKKYQNSSRRLFFLDYEGTLASWGSPTSIILISPQRTLDVLTALLEDARNTVYVMSGRRPEEMERLFRRVPGLGLIAENGCFLREAGAEEWDELADTEKMTSWKQGVKKILEYYTERVEGSYVEERHCSLIFEYSECEDTVGAARQAAECASHINDACASQHVHAIPISGALVIEPMDLSKATATTQIFELMKTRHEAKGPLMTPDFLLVVGDSREDEIVFRWANKLGKDTEVRDVTTVSLGSKSTEATATLTQGVTGVLTTLSKLAALSPAPVPGSGLRLHA